MFFVLESYLRNFGLDELEESKEETCCALLHSLSSILSSFLLARQAVSGMEKSP